MVIQIVSKRDRLAIPLGPGAALVAGKQNDRSAERIEYRLILECLRKVIYRRLIVWIA
jgi:hypothetical protein